MHRYGYDPRDRLTTYTDPLQQTERYDYDAAGNLVNVTDRKGQATKYVYDSLDRLRQITYADGSTIGYSYDQGNRVTQIVDSVNGSYSYTYDNFDRIVSETTPKATVSYSYYANGLRKTMTVSGQPTLRYSYDSGNRLRRIDQDAGATNNNTVQSTAFSYDSLNRRTQTQLPNGMTQNYSYDDAGQLTGIVYRGADGSVIGDLSYTYDATGKRIKIGGSLARTSLPDDVGNATVDAANRLTSWKGVAFTYDANGNLIADETSTYVWNTRDQLAQIKDGNGSQVAAFAYDALGRRLSKTVNGKALGYVHDGMNVVQTLDGANVNNSDSSKVLTNYLTGLRLDEVYAASGVVAGTLRSSNYLSNALGSTISLFDQTGTKLVDYTYDPYGNTSSDGLDGNPFQYTGRESDETGLYYYRARYYSSQFGRFISSDPMGLKGGINTYAYVRGNPVNGIDPTGLIDGWTDPSGPPDMISRPPINIVRGTPSDACACSSGGKNFSAPPGANYNDVYRAGQNGGYNPLAADNAIGHFGKYDFQRNYMDNVFIGAYTDASNFSVGVYMRGAGFSRDQTIAIGQAFARLMSKNAGAAAQADYWKAGWDAANSGNLSGICK